MENISNGSMWDDCTKCPNCGKQSWHIYKCKCGKYFCTKCSVNESEDILECSCGDGYIILVDCE